MKADNALSKLVRPSLLIWFSALLSFMAIVDGNFFDMTIKEVYVVQISALLMVAFSAYFVGKSYEHGVRINKGDDDV